jgi:pimeloyl-ACP methyl ester carboxylesterase
MGKIKVRIGLVVLMLILAIVGVANAAPKIVSEKFYVDSPEPNIKLYLLNKHAEGAKSFPAEKIALFVHGATYPSETAFDLDLPGGSWMNYAVERGYDTYMVDVRGYGKSTRPASMDVPPDKNPPFATTSDAVQDVGAAINFILKRRGVAKLNLVGWSWGTAIMAGYTAQNNDKVEKLVLYAPLWIPKGPAPISGLGAYRAVGKESARARSIRGIPESRVEEISPKAWGEIWWDSVQTSDPVGAKATPPVLRAPNGVIKDIGEFWAQGKPTYDPANIRVPTMLILAEWDQDTPLYMAQELFGKLVNAPYKRHVILGAGTHAIVLEKNRMDLITQVQQFLDEQR